MTKIAAVKTQNSNVALWFDAGELDIKVGENVVVETARGVEFGTLDQEIFEATEEQIKELKSELKPVMRIATQRDIERAEEMKSRGKNALEKFRELAATTNEDMNPISVEYLLDGKKAVFYFSAPERQDFRELIKKLSSEFRLRVDLRQINEREKSAKISGIGFCGQELCCARLGRCPKHVSIKQAKVQGLALNPENISGMCGKLLCCLDYEYNDYEEFSKRAPKLKAKILTPEGEAVVSDVNMPKELVEVKIVETEKRTKVPLADMEYDKAFAKKIATDKASSAPNKIGSDAWERANSDISGASLESVYTTTNLSGSEKLATGVVKILPSTKKHEPVKKVEDTKKPRKRPSSKTTKNQHPQNVYESKNSTTVRRRSRTLDSGSARPGHRSSGLHKRG